MIQVNELTKIYNLKKSIFKSSAEGKIAVNGISFEAKRGEIFGLLGANGAGKTTTLRCISTLIKPTSGQIKVNGYFIDKEGQNVRKSIAFLTNDLKLDKHFSPDQTVEYFGKIHGLPTEEIKFRKKELFDTFGITGFEHKKISTLSTGMSQKTSIVTSLIHNPDIIIFDEPTNGLDVITAKVVTDYLFKLKDEGKLVIISTHIMNVAQKLCDRVAIMMNGEIIIQDTVEEILLKTHTNSLEDAFFKLYKEESEMDE